jgi:hypothetical protein
MKNRGLALTTPHILPQNPFNQFFKLFMLSRHDTHNVRRYISIRSVNALIHDSTYAELGYLNRVFAPKVAVAPTGFDHCMHACRPMFLSRQANLILGEVFTPYYY